jgi:hypothetical protein
MSRIALVGLVTLACLAPAGRADDFAIDLEARVGKTSRTAHAERLAVGAPSTGRELLELKAGDRVTVKWTLTCTARREVFKDVVVHLFIVKEEKAGQRTVPKLDRDVLAETAATMDFMPKDRAEGELTFTVEKAGAYLLRLETVGAARGFDSHEQFAALDLVARGEETKR